MKVKFEVTADLDTGTLTIVCPEMFELTDKGWGPEIRTNFRRDYKYCLSKVFTKIIRSRFMAAAKFTKEELERAEVQK